MKETGIIYYEDDGYPENLRETAGAPKKLYFRGRADLLRTRCVSVAGSRRASPEGLRAAELIGKRLAECGITVVSGLAEGIDTAAHRGALSVGGNTIAVLANGLDRSYPASNSALQREIEQKGLLISEYPDGTTARKHFFPMRNRIISGLSDVTVIAEAALRSGSLITAEAAADQGRAVFAVPGNFTKECCAGTNHLLSDGADPIFDINQFLLDIGVDVKDSGRPPADLSDEEMLVYDTVRRMGEVSNGEIASSTLLPPRLVNGLITVLEMKGLVQTEMGKVFLSVKGM